MIATIAVGVATGGFSLALSGAALSTAGAFASYAAVAGTVMQGVGLVTGNEKWSKIGGLVSLGAGLASGFGAAAGEGASAAALDASAAGLEGVTADAAANSLVGVGGDLGAAAGSVGTETTLGVGTQLGGVDAAADAQSMFSSGVTNGANGAGQVAGLSQPTLAAQPVGGQVASFSSDTLGSTLNAAPQTGNGMLDSFSKLGANVKQNKELYQLGGQMLSGMFGPEAEAMDYRKKMDERRRRNINTIIPMGQLNRG